MQTVDNFASAEYAWVSPDLKSPAKVFRYSIQKHNQVDKIHPTEKPIKLYKWILDKYGYCKCCANLGGTYEDVVGDGGSRMWVDCENCNVAENKAIRILDTHLGSGSSRIAAYEMGFDFTAFEIDKDYYDAQEKRFKNFIKQLTLFPH